MYVYVCTYMYIYVHICTYMYICVYMYICAYVYIYTYIHNHPISLYIGPKYKTFISYSVYIITIDFSGLGENYSIDMG